MCSKGRSPNPASASPGLWCRLRILRWPAAAALLLLLALMFFEESLIFFPSRYPEGNWQPADLQFEDAWFAASDGTRLHGWYAPAQQPRAQLLFAHGNAGHLAHRADFVRYVQRELNVSVLIFDYRGYGRSEGSPSESGVLADVRAARDWLAERAGVRPDQIVLMGESIGGAVVVDLAAADGARGLILENTFSSLPETAAFHFPWLPVHYLLRTRLDSAAKIARYSGPLLQCHGDADTIVPFEQGTKLHAAANEPKRMVVVEGGDHNDGRNAEWLAEIDEFISALPGS